MRTKLIAANWKMNTNLAEAHILADGVRGEAEHMERIEIVLCPPTIWLTDLAHNIPKGAMPHLKLGAQNMYYEPRGAFTGETSPLMVREIVEYVLVGHSERTHLFKEEENLISHKVRAAFEYGIKPILCIGEDTKEPDSKRHLVHALNHLMIELNEEEIQNLVIAYEPVWAIGTGNPATPEYAQEMVNALRQAVDPQTRILYGGSVTEDIARGFLEQPDIDGLLVGGASLKLKPFLTMCQIADDLSYAN